MRRRGRKLKWTRGNCKKRNSEALNAAEMSPREQKKSSGTRQLVINSRMGA
jgi:hypothetical protein